MMLIYITTQVYDVNISLDDQVLDKVVGVPVQETRSLKDEYRSEKFLQHIGNLDDLNFKSITKKSLKG